MNKIKLYTMLSLILIIVIFAILFFAYRFELTNNQRGFIIIAGLFMIIFGFLLDFQNKIKWFELKKKSEESK